MSTINRINYQNKRTGSSDLEIVDLQLFFATRAHRLLEKDVRLNFWVILYITEGQGRHFIDFKAFDYKAGDILFIQKNQVQRFVINHDVKGYIMHINEPFLFHLNQRGNNVFLEFIDRALGSPVVSSDTSSDSTNRKLIEILYIEYNRNAEEDHVLFIKALFESFILSVREDFSARNIVFQTSEYRIFTEFRELVEIHYTEHFTLDRYAERMGVSKKTINQSTRAIVDLSAKELVNNRLFLEMKRYLSQGEMLIYEIAEMLGFDEPANMTNFFKKRAGMSPRQFKKSLGLF